MTTSTRLKLEDRTTPTRDILAFFALLASGMAVGLALWWLSGPPPIPSSAPDLNRLARLLTSADVPYDDVIYVARAIGWLALAYLGCTVALRVMVNVVARLSDGASWSKTALDLSDLLTLPVVRRLVDGALVGVVVVSIWLRARPGLAEAVPSTFDVVALNGGALAAAQRSAFSPPPELSLEAGSPALARYVPYTVAQGDNLWSIARRFYSDGARYPLIFAANEGRAMMTGEPFTDPRLIRPGWVLDVPLPANNVALAGDRVTYRVQSGDSLWCIAQGMLGDGFRWVELWQMNEGRVMTDGRTFVNPDLIHPGWVLELPLEAKTEAAIEPAEPIETAPLPTPEVASPTPQPVAPTLAPAGELAPSPEPTALPGRPDDGGGIDLPLPSGKQAFASAAALVLAGGAVLAVRAAVRHGRGLRVTATDKRRRQPHGDAGKVVLAARSLLSGLAEVGFDDLRLLTAREMERYIEFLVECGPGDAEAVVRVRYDLGRRLACRVDGEVEDATHVIMKLSSFQRLAGLLAGGTTDELLLVPVGAGNGVYYLNLAAVGSVLLAGDPHDTGQVVSAWTATLSATHRSDALAILVASNVSGEMADFGVLAPTEDAGQWPAEQLATELRDALVAREEQANPAAAMPITALVGISDAWESEALDLETLLRRGPGQGIYVVTVTQNAAEAESLGPFGARVEFGGSLGDQGEGEARYVDADDLTLTIGHRPPIVLQPITVRTELLPQHRPLAGPELDETWEPEAGMPSTEDVAWDEVRPKATAADREDWPDEAALFASPSDIEEEQRLEAGEQAPPSIEAEAAMTDEDSTLPLEKEESGPDNGASNAANPVFRVQCFGSFEVTAAGRPASWRIQKSRELFAYLIAHRGTAVPREEVAEALWPEGLPEQVDRLLSNAAYHLRRAFKGSTEADLQVLSIAGQRYHLHANLFRVDADAFVAHLRRAEDLDGADALVEYERALAIYQGDFLAREPYEWAAPHRQDYQRRFIAAAHTAARLAFDSRDVGRALEFYGAVLTRDPIDEEAARGAMRCYGKLGDSNGVRKVYKVLFEALRREFDDDNAEPLPETKALYEELSRTSVG